MEAQKLYRLPKLEYDYNALEPYISEELLRLHHEKHHAAYVKGANTIIEKMDKARTDNADFDTKATFKELSFHIGGQLLHSLFWENLSPASKGGGNPSGTIAKLLDEEYGSFERFKKIFSQTANSVEGSGWAALTFCMGTQRPMIMQVEKHNTNVYPMFRILMVLDVWEHAYYLDYKNDRGKFVEAFWNIVNWDEVNSRLEKILNS
ncbi:MAG: superoxide dismutase [Eubacteriales bacterium]|nr:superoxide dismutase [Eubacteriales bacterium]